jgi:hypothetical protein
MGVYTILTEFRTKPWGETRPAGGRRGGSSSFRGNLRVVILVGLLVSPASAQTLEIAPFAGYRFGNDFFELATNHDVDLDGAPVFGGIFNFEIGDGLSFEGVFTHQQARVTTPAGRFDGRAQVSVVVDHWLAGGRQEFGVGRVRPFLSGLLGLTRYGIEGDNEMRFVLGWGSGVTLALERRVGLRLDGRVFTTFEDAEARASACRPGVCLVGVDLRVLWQVEFTAGLVFKTP